MLEDITMSTRSFIGILQPNGNAKYIYCHNDGYLDHNGKILIDNYTDAQKVNELINLGDLSVLGPVIGDAVDFERRYTDKDYYNSTKGQCIAYGRDRGESGCEPKTSSTDSLDEEYNYVFDPDTNEWYVKCPETDYEWDELAVFFDGIDDVSSSTRTVMGADDDDFIEEAATEQDKADELQDIVEADFDYVIAGIERLEREGQFDSAIEVLSKMSSTLNSAVGVIGDDFAVDEDIEDIDAD